MNQMIIDSKSQAEEPTHDGLSFLFIKEVKVAKSGEDRDFRTLSGRKKMIQRR